MWKCSRAYWKVIVEREDDLQWAEQNAARVGDDCLLYLQPEWSVYERMMPLLVEYAKAHPQWSKRPLNGCVPDVSRKICNPLSCRVRLSLSSG